MIDRDTPYPSFDSMVHRLRTERINVCEYQSVAADAMLSRAVCDTHRDVIERRFVHGLRTFIVGLPEKKITIHRRWPTDWWQAFRERWMPKWWLQKHPVQYSRVDVDETIYKAVCPHVPHGPTDEGPCLQWLVMMQDGER